MKLPSIILKRYFFYKYPEIQCFKHNKLTNTFGAPSVNAAIAMHPQIVQILFKNQAILTGNWSLGCSHKLWITHRSKLATFLTFNCHSFLSISQFLFALILYVPVKIFQLCLEPVLMCVQEFSEQRFFAFISLCADWSHNGHQNLMHLYTA